MIKLSISLSSKKSFFWFVFGSCLHKTFVRVIILHNVKKNSIVFLKLCQILPLKERKNDSKTNHLNYLGRSLIPLILLFYLQHFASFTYLNVRILKTHWKPVYCLLLDTTKRRKLQIFCIKQNRDLRSLKPVFLNMHCF